LLNLINKHEAKVTSSNPSSPYPCVDMSKKKKKKKTNKQT
jgi:hypothetical protein